MIAIFYLVLSRPILELGKFRVNTKKQISTHPPGPTDFEGCFLVCSKNLRLGRATGLLLWGKSVRGGVDEEERGVVDASVGKVPATKAWGPHLGSSVPQMHPFVTLALGVRGSQRQADPSELTGRDSSQSVSSGLSESPVSKDEVESDSDRHPFAKMLKISKHVVLPFL